MCTSQEAAADTDAQKKGDDEVGERIVEQRATFANFFVVCGYMTQLGANTITISL